MSTTTSQSAFLAGENFAQHQGLWQRYAKSGAGSQPEQNLLELYLPLVKSVVGRLAICLPPRISGDDLYSSGLVGLLNAVRRFNPKNGSSFKQFARTKVSAAIFEELRRLSWTPNGIEEMARKVIGAIRELIQRDGRIPTDGELAFALNLPAGKYLKLLEELRPAAYLDIESPQNNVETQMRPAAFENGVRDSARLIQAHLNQLPKLERQILALYYLEELRVSEIAEAFGLAESRVCHVHSKAILALKALVKEPNANAVAVY